MSTTNIFHGDDNLDDYDLDDYDFETKNTNYLKKTLLSEVFKELDNLTAAWEPISTGFESLDKVLNGGLIPQLYILGAESGTGKSTFLLNAAEKIAQSKQPVIYFSLEMPADYIARLVICHRLLEEESRRGKDLAINNFTNERGLKELHEKPKLKSAFESYQKLGKHFIIIARDKNHPKINAKDIYKEVEKELKNPEKQNENKTPIVIVDYLQILDEEDGKNSFDQRTIVDYNVGMLSQITTELKVPVIAISSLNRDAYKGKRRDIRISDFKESGRIEYSADVVLALQSEASDNSGGIKKRTLKLSVLKNRYGEKDADVRLSFYPEFGHFEDGKTSAAESVPREQIRYILNSRISTELHINRDNFGFHKNLSLNSRGKKTAYLLSKINDEDDGAQSLTLWDLAVMDAVCAVTKKGIIPAFTIAELIEFMCGKTKVTHLSVPISDKFRKALYRLNNREIIIDITDELEMRSKALPEEEYAVKDAERANLPKDFGNTDGRKFIKGVLLPLEKEEKHNEFRFEKGRKPILFEYTANISGQYISYDKKLWEHKEEQKADGSKKNFTMQKMLIRYYLIREISIMKYYWEKGQNKKHVKRDEITVFSPEKGASSLLALVVQSDSSRLEKLKDKDIKNLKSHAKFSSWLNSARADTEMILNDLKTHGFISEFVPVDGENDALSYKIGPT